MNRLNTRTKEKEGKKNTFLKMILYLCVCLVAQSYPTLCDPIDCSPPGSSVHGILQARILEWVAISFSGESSQTKDRTHISSLPCIAVGFFTH